MSLLTGERIVAGVIAGNRCFVLMIPQQVFNTHILTNPKAVGFLSPLLADRKRAMSVDLVTAQARAVATSDDPYALSLHNDEPGKVLVLNVGTLAVCIAALVLPSLLVTRIAPARAIRFD